MSVMSQRTVHIQIRDGGITNRRYVTSWDVFTVCPLVAKNSIIGALTQNEAVALKFKKTEIMLSLICLYNVTGKIFLTL